MSRLRRATNVFFIFLISIVGVIIINDLFHMQWDECELMNVVKTLTIGGMLYAYLTCK